MSTTESAGLLSVFGAAFGSIVTVLGTVNRAVRMVDSVVAAGEVHAAFIHESSVEDVSDKRIARAAKRAALALPA